MSEFQSEHWSKRLAALDEALAALLWDQWFSIGGSASARKFAVPFAIDIEALLLATTRFGVQDPRIFEQALDWLSLNGKLVSLQRFKNLQQTFAFGDFERVGGLSAFMIEQGFPNWKTFQKGSVKVAESPVGYSVRGMSRKPAARAPETLSFTLRNFFGMNARAEIALYMLTHPDFASAKTIAGATGWLSKTVQFTLKEWEQAGIVSSVAKGRESRYRLNSGTFDTVSPGAPVGWFQQPEFYRGCAQLTEILRKLSSLESERVEIQAMTIRKLIDSIRGSFIQVGADNLFAQLDSKWTGETMVEAFDQEVLKAVRVLEERSFLVSAFWES